MRLTTFTDFALRALMRAAGEPERTLTTEQIAREFGISRDHVTKAVREAARAGFVVTFRGGGGGFRLARPAGEITLGQVVRALEGGFPLVECFRRDGGTCPLGGRCRLKRRLAAAQEAFLQELDRTPLSDCAVTPALEPA